MIVELSGDYKALNRDNIYDYILKIQIQQFEIILGFFN